MDPPLTPRDLDRHGRIALVWMKLFPTLRDVDRLE